MYENTDIAVAEPVVRPQRERESKENAKRPKRQPRYYVLLWNDNDHSYEYVVGMMQALFGYPPEKGFMIAREVDTGGKAICMTTTMELAELKRDQIHAYGKDISIQRCKGSMSASIEPEPE